MSKHKTISNKIFTDQKKLELAKAITTLRRFSADDVAEAFGTSRQNINYHMKKEESK